MSSLLSSILGQDTSARAFKLAAILLCVLLAGCQGMAGKPSEIAAGAPLSTSLEQSQDWTILNTDPQPPQDIWERMRAGFQLQDEIDVNPRIERQRLWFVGNPSFIEAASERGSPYIHYVVESLEQRRMPMELALLPVIESAYNPLAYSRSNAVGIWQFIPSTGLHFNLRQTNWYDGRRDIMASTNAALAYLSNLHEMFNGDWLLALAAYNAGEGTVSRAIERNQKLGLPTDYWNLPLPKETQDYVPKLLALSQIVLSPAAYGINLNPIANEPYFEVVELKQRMDLSRVAAMADIDENELFRLNPAFKKRVTVDGPQLLLVPSDKADSFAASLSQMKPETLVNWQEYKVRSGDSLHGIATRYGITVAALKEANRLTGNHLKPGEVLSIPADRAAATRLATRSIETAVRERSHTVASGDNLWGIARDYKVSVADLQRWNGLKSGSSLKLGQILKIKGTTLSGDQERQSVTYYKVRQGDSLSMIAKRFNVEASHLQRWNPGSDPLALKPGQTLTLYLPN
jgi:membrane-bound lytic murein transglycosylase D